MALCSALSHHFASDFIRLHCVHELLNAYKLALDKLTLMKSTPSISALPIEILACRTKAILGKDFSALTNIFKIELKPIALLGENVERAFQITAPNPMRRNSSASARTACKKFINFHKRLMEVEYI